MSDIYPITLTRYNDLDEAGLIDENQIYQIYDTDEDIAQELIRTRKALGIVIDMLKEIDKTRSVANHKIGTPDKTLNAGIMFCWATPDQIHNTLTETTALMQGGEK